MEYRSPFQYYAFFPFEDDALNIGEDINLGQLATNGLQPAESVTISNTFEIPDTTPDGNYFVIAVADDEDGIDESDEDNNVAVSAETVSVDNPIFTGIGDNLSGAIRLDMYPNPVVNGLLNLKLPESYILGNLRIYDVEGNPVYGKQGSDLQRPIKVGHLASGLYIIEVQSNNKWFKGTFLKN